MSMAAIDHVEAFDTTLEKTDAWLNELSDELGTANRHQAYEVLRAFLHALRDRLPVESAAKLGAQLPMLVRGFYYEGWNPTHTPDKMDAPARGAAGAPAGKIAMLPIAGVDDTTRLFRLSARCFVAVRARADHTLTI